MMTTTTTSSSSSLLLPLSNSCMFLFLFMIFVQFFVPLQQQQNDQNHQQQQQQQQSSYLFVQSFQQVRVVRNRPLFQETIDTFYHYHPSSFFSLLLSTKIYQDKKRIITTTTISSSSSPFSTTTTRRRTTTSYLQLSQKVVDHEHHNNNNHEHDTLQSNIIDDNKGHETRGSTTTTTVATTNKVTIRQQQQEEEKITTGIGAISLPLDELMIQLGGKKGRVQLVWDCYRLGVDPIVYYTQLLLLQQRKQKEQEEEKKETTEGSSSSSSSSISNQQQDNNEQQLQRIQQLLPSQRRKLTLGYEALQKLSNTYNNNNHNHFNHDDNTSTTSSSNSNSILFNTLDTSVARIEHITQDKKDRTTKLLLRLSRDDLLVETVIIPFLDENENMDHEKEDDENHDPKQQQQHQLDDMGNGKTNNNYFKKKKKKSTTSSSSSSSSSGRCTVCISSQVGCLQGCTFCATGKMGKFRNLSTAEIVIQFFYAQQIVHNTYLSTSTTGSTNTNPLDPMITSLLPLPRISNVVFMGMGEPGDNVNHVRRTVQILTDPFRYQLSMLRVTVSTVGPTPESFTNLLIGNHHVQNHIINNNNNNTTTTTTNIVHDDQQENIGGNILAWSVHSVNDTIRKQLVPTTKYSMNELRQGYMNALLLRPKHLRISMIEIVLIHEMNDQLMDAELIATFCHTIIQQVPGCKLMVNLIPYNPIHIPSTVVVVPTPPPITSTQTTTTPIINRPSTSSLPYHTYQKPSPETVQQFLNHLRQRGIRTHIRTTRGDEEDAACGQLVTKNERKKRER